MTVNGQSWGIPFIGCLHDKAAFGSFFCAEDLMYSDNRLY